jgi:dihydrofolate synthase/folylpolyglutamate synthase
MMRINPTLEVITALCHALGDPQTRFASIQVVGSNGKTSTARIIEALLRAEKLRVGLTTSPALVDETERIRIAGEPLPDELWDEVFDAVSDAVQVASRRDADLPASSEFEILTAMALQAFATCEVEVAVVEAGIGGTWDATCILSPAVVVFTSVSLEHTALLGETVAQIAREKSGAIKPGATVVLSDGVTDEQARAIIIEKADLVGALVLTRPHEHATRRFVDHLIDEPGALERLPVHIPCYQLPNIKAAVTAAEALLGRPLDPKTIPTTLEALTFPGRFEILERSDEGHARVIFDGAHNPEAATHLARAIADARTRGILADDPVIALGVFSDKDLAGIVAALDPVAHAFLPLTAPDPDRALSVCAIADALDSASKRPVISQWDRQRPLVVTGSLSLSSAAHDFAGYQSSLIE